MNSSTKLLCLLVVMFAQNAFGQIAIDPNHPNFVFDGQEFINRDGSPNLGILLVGNENQSLIEMTLKQREDLKKSILEAGFNNFAAMQDKATFVL